MTSAVPYGEVLNAVELSQVVPGSLIGSGWWARLYSRLDLRRNDAGEQEVTGIFFDREAEADEVFVIVASITTETLTCSFALSSAGGTGWLATKTDTDLVTANAALT